MRENDETLVLQQKTGVAENPREIITLIYKALLERGHNPVRNIAGYLASGEPAYITAHNNARRLVQRLDRLDLLEELVRHYLGLEEQASPKETGKK